MEDQFPPLVARFQSMFIDTLLVIVLMIVVYQVLDHFPNAPDWLRIIIFLGIFIFYEPVCLTFGCTLGNYVKRIRVKRFSDNSRRIDFFHALTRYVVKVCLGWLSFITVHTNLSKRALHDLASGSVMVNNSFIPLEIAVAKTIPPGFETL